MIGVYKITSPSGKIYIGSSIDINKRWVSYKTLNCYSQRKLYNSLKKHGVENHTFEILTECDIDNLLEFESYYGNLYNVLGDGGLNCKLPNKDDKYKSVREESKILMSISSTGIRHTEKTKQKIRQAVMGDKNPFFGKSHSEITKQKIRETKKNNFNDVTRERMAKAQLGKTTWMKGKSHSEYSKEKNRNSHLKYAYTIVCPDNSVIIVTNLKQFCAKNNLHDGALGGTLKGVNCRGIKVNHHKNYRIIDKSIISNHELKLINN